MGVISNRLLPPQGFLCVCSARRIRLDRYVETNLLVNSACDNYSAYLSDCVYFFPREPRGQFCIADPRNDL